MFTNLPFGKKCAKLAVMKIATVIAGNPWRQNTYVVVTDSATILVDAGSDFSKILQAYRRIADGAFNIDAILLTHIHFDHIMGLKSVLENSECPVYVSAHGKANINSDEWTENHWLNLELGFDTSRFVTVKNGAKIKVNDETVTFFETKGHSPNSGCFLIEDALFTGDTRFAFATGRVDLKGGSEKEMLASLKVIDGINYKLGYPGHGIPFKKETN